jgi:K+:H+ antiporter
MGATSLLISLSPKVANTAMRLPHPHRLKFGEPFSFKPKEIKKDRIIVVGYGVNRRNVALSARSENVPYVIIEIAPEIVKTEGITGEPINYGDATQEEVLHHANIMTARVVVIAISDVGATRRITELSRWLNPDVFIIARTRYVLEMNPLHDLGANEVIPEEYETSVEIFARVLERYNVPFYTTCKIGWL